MKRSLSSLRLRLISLVLLAIIPALGLTFDPQADGGGTRGFVYRSYG